MPRHTTARRPVAIALALAVPRTEAWWFAATLGSALLGYCALGAIGS